MDYVIVGRLGRFVRTWNVYLNYFANEDKTDSEHTKFLLLFNFWSMQECDLFAVWSAR
jgi:hypothetical protein